MRAGSSVMSRVTALGLSAVLASCSSGTPSPRPLDSTKTKLEWKDLIPIEEREKSQRMFAFAMQHLDHTGDDAPKQFGSFKTVAALEGHTVELLGYVVPLDTDETAAMSSFLFVPTMGACIHVPPPPPDQMIYVTLLHPIPTPDEGEAQLLRGILHTQTYDLEVASAAYAMHDAVLTPVTTDP